MPSLFMNRPGQAIALDNPDGDLGLPLTIDGIQGSWFPQFKSILTELGFALNGNYQFAHTCKDVIYVYVFGRRISQMRVSGLSFADGCPGGGSSGIEQVIGFYNDNNIAVRDTPIQIQIGTTGAGRFRGYMTDLRADIIKPEARISQFSFIFHVFPGGAP